MAQILIVDDNRSRLRALQAALPHHKLVCTTNVERALTAMFTRHFELLIAPIYLDSGDIFTLVRSVFELKKDLRIVLVSTDKEQTSRYATDPIQTAAGFLGVYRYILMDAPDTVTLKAELERCLPAECLATLSSDTGTIYEL